MQVLDELDLVYAGEEAYAGMLADAGIPFDRKKFSPHITLVRKPMSRFGQIPEEVLKKPFKAGMNDHYIGRGQ